MPSVPSRLAAVSACALALGLAAPALADKKPGNSPPPPPVSTLAPPGQTSTPAPSTTPQVQTPSTDQPSTGGSSGFTQKLNKGKNNGYTAAPKQKTSDSGGSSGYTEKQDKGSKTPASSNVSSSAGSVQSPSSTSTPSGGSVNPTPTTPTTTGGGAQAKPKGGRAKPNRGGRRSNRPSSGVTTPRTFAPVTRPVSPVGVAPVPAPASPKPERREGTGDALARVRVSVVTQTVHDLVQVLPAAVKAAIGAMAALLLAAIAAWATVTLRARRLQRQRGQLVQEVGLLQTALLPEVPAQIGPLAASVAYRPADGPGAGGDFYDVFQLENGNIGLVLGDVAGHGRDALARTALLRYTLRAYVETGLEPRLAMRLAGETLDHNLSGGFATAAVAVYEPASGKLTFSCAGHPPPILLGAPEHDPVVACSAPPIGVGERTGMRQTTVTLPAGSLACFFTDGLAEARVDGELFGRERLAELIQEIGGEPTASDLIERFRDEVHHMPDDMAACILRPIEGEAVAASGPAERLEELELRDGGERDLRRFLAACGIPAVEVGDLVRSANARAEDYGGAIVRVKLIDGEHPQVSLVLPLVESLATAAV
ncbi:MAG TPA: PP2C family protein-serine/threonine phosphatase [Thermoleophilaceae bacterium]